jgi:alkanesulfonate monooxygenase SsuD/methylene tetrahydromethanopterin reductase-like flavin-dependent oxidoreductase (luciferase family)
VLSGGRLDVAIGAGWNRPEYDAIGLPFDPTPVRQARLEEAVAVLKGCFGDGPFSFAGEHYAIRDLDGHPKPVQRPHPPFLIGGGGRRTLALAGREADIVGLAPRILSGQRSDPRSLTVAATAEKIGWVREAAGDRFDDLVFNIYPSGWPITVTADPRGEAARVVEHLRGRTAVDLTVDDDWTRRTSSWARSTGSWRSSVCSANAWASRRSWSATSTRWPGSWSGLPEPDVGSARGGRARPSPPAVASRARWTYRPST